MKTTVTCHYMPIGTARIKNSENPERMLELGQLRAEIQNAPVILKNIFDNFL